MPIDNIDLTFYIPPVFRVDNHPDLLRSRRGYRFFKERQAKKELEPQRQIEVPASENVEEDALVQLDESAAARSFELSAEEREAQLNMEQLQLQQMQNALADAQRQMAEETSAARIAEILKQMVDSIQRMMDAKNASEFETRMAQTSDVLRETGLSRKTGGVENGFLSAEDILRWHLEGMGEYDKKSAEAAYHEVRQSQPTRPDGAPIVPPLHHEDEYL